MEQVKMSWQQKNAHRGARTPDHQPGALPTELGGQLIEPLVFAYSETHNMEERTIEILHQVQRTFACHRKAAVSLRAVQSQDPQKFQTILKRFLKPILVIFKREPSIERLISFIVSFATLQDETGTEGTLQTCVWILEYALKCSASKEKSVRFRSTQIVAGIINGLAPDADLSDSLWNRLLEKMSARTRDKVPIIRAQSTIALSRLQDPSQEDDPVIQEYIRMLECDPSVDVRRAVLNSMGTTKRTVGHIIRRTKDTNEAVRIQAYTILKSKVNIKVLSISQRSELIDNGLKDRSEKVREVCVDLLCDCWLSSLSGDYIKFLKYFDVQESEESVEKMLRAMFARVTPTHHFSFEQFTTESAILWRVYCAHLRSAQSVDHEALERVSPTHLESFSNYLSSQSQTQDEESEFITKQLLLGCRSLDLSDEAGRRHLLDTLGGMSGALEISEELVWTALNVIHHLTADREKFTREAISELKGHLEVLQLDPNLPQERLEMKEVLAEQIKLRILTLSENLLEKTNRRSSVAGELFDEVIHPQLQNEHLVVKSSALRCLGLYCLNSPDAARAHLHTLIDSLDEEEEAVQYASLRSIFDCLLLFGKDLAEDQLIETIQKLSGMIGCEHNELRSLVVEGFSKLFAYRVCTDEKILAKMNLEFFHPETEDILSLRQCLTVFYTIMSSTSKEHQSTLAKSFETTLSTIYNEPVGSTLRDISLPNLIQFFLFHCDRNKLQNNANDNSPNDDVIDMFAAMCTEILSQGQDGKILCRQVHLFASVLPFQSKSMSRVRRLIEKISFKDVMATKSLARIVKQLPAEESESEEEGEKEIDSLQRLDEEKIERKRTEREEKKEKRVVKVAVKRGKKVKKVESESESEMESESETESEVESEREESVVDRPKARSSKVVSDDEVVPQASEEPEREEVQVKLASKVEEDESSEEEEPTRPSRPARKAAPRPAAKRRVVSESEESESESESESELESESESEEERPKPSTTRQPQRTVQKRRIVSDEESEEETRESSRIVVDVKKDQRREEEKNEERQDKKEIAQKREAPVVQKKREVPVVQKKEEKSVVQKKAEKPVVQKKEVARESEEMNQSQVKKVNRRRIVSDSEDENSTLNSSRVSVVDRSPTIVPAKSVEKSQSNATTVVKKPSTASARPSTTKRPSSESTQLTSQVKKTSIGSTTRVSPKSVQGTKQEAVARKPPVPSRASTEKPMRKPPVPTSTTNAVQRKSVEKPTQKDTPPNLDASIEVSDDIVNNVLASIMQAMNCSTDISPSSSQAKKSAPVKRPASERPTAVKRVSTEKVAAPKPLPKNRIADSKRLSDNSVEANTRKPAVPTFRKSVAPTKAQKSERTTTEDKENSQNQPHTPPRQAGPAQVKTMNTVERKRWKQNVDEIDALLDQ
ncbi:hypothetical protein PROFUN_05953 [Planoprotostelium fungivorum]|uniref:Nuclear condensin complex subunit 3 C-terminal domain-containing protein n=1 Tax=Planoprotostelium fungivorum TaxID=1890364 RepID=A0A2P6N7Q7_9EUKA|nr:hypothetical protein PROFUN_05953 [Planoprotostelium fungivorum]